MASGSLDAEGDGLIRDVWYVATSVRELKRARSMQLRICDQAFTLTRGEDGKPEARPDPASRGPTTLPCAASEGLIWVYIPEPGPATGDPGSPPQFNGPDADHIKLLEPVVLDAHFDDAVYGLLDPAHGPYVHASPLWRTRRTLKDKAKAYLPSHQGFTMAPHTPVNSDLYKIIGRNITVHIEFSLPGRRAEHIRSDRHSVLGLTALTPVDARTTIIRQIFYWNSPVLNLLRPIAHLFSRPFLLQDAEIMRLRRIGLDFGARGMLIRDADALFIWYRRLKQELRDSRAEGRAFINPIEPTTLRWRT